MAFGIRRPSPVILIRVQLLDPSRRLKNIDPIFNKGTRSISTSSEVIAGAGPCMQCHLKTRRPCLPTSRWKRCMRWRCLFQRPRTLGKFLRRAFSRPLETLGGASALCRGDGGGKRWSDAAGTQRRRATRDSGRGALLAILSLEGAHMLGPRGVRSQALRLRRLDIAANAGAAYLTLNHFSHPDISQAGYASLNPWRGRKGAGLRVRHRIRGRASCMA